MNVSLDLVRAHLKTDMEDVELPLIKQYMTSAQTLCENCCNRKFYDSSTSRAADFPVALAEKVSLATARDTLLGVTTDDYSIAAIWDHYRHDMSEVTKRINGIVVDDAIVAAVLMTVGYLYVNRSANEPPEAAKRILEPYLWIGDLAWT